MPLSWSSLSIELISYVILWKICFGTYFAPDHLSCGAPLFLCMSSSAPWSSLTSCYRILLHRGVATIGWGTLARMLLELLDRGGATDTLIVDATHLRKGRTTSSLCLKKGGRSRLTERTKGGISSNLHAGADGLDRPLRMFLIADRRSDQIAARAFLVGLPSAKHLSADRGYDVGS